jgi:hypothetical protein
MIRRKGERYLLYLTPHIQPHIPTIRIVVDVIVSNAMPITIESVSHPPPKPSHTTPPTLLRPSLFPGTDPKSDQNLQFPIQPRLKPLLTLHRATHHRHNNQLTTRLSADREGRIDGDADCKSGDERGEACGRHV